MELKEIIKNKLEEIGSFQCEFKMNNAIINIIVNKELLEINQMFITINIKNEIKTFYGNNEIKKFIDFDKHLDLNYDQHFKFQILGNILINKKMDEFWKVAIISIKNKSISIEANALKKLSSKKNWNKKLGCYIFCKKRMPNGKYMTEKQADHLINWFGLDKEMIYQIKKSGLTIATTWDILKKRIKACIEVWKIRNFLYKNA